MAPPAVSQALMAAGVEGKRDRGREGEGRVLADIVIGRGVAAFDRAAADRVQRLQPRHDFAGRKQIDAEAATGELGHGAHEDLAGTVDGVERAREAGGHPPAQLGQVLGHGRRGTGGGDCRQRARDQSAPIRHLPRLLRVRRQA